MVSPSPASCSSTNVALLLKSMGAPQLEQKRPVEETSALQEEQNMPGGFYHRGSSQRTPGLLGGALHLHSGAVREDFGYSLHYLGGVVAHGDDAVGAVLRGML